MKEEVKEYIKKNKLLTILVILILIGLIVFIKIKIGPINGKLICNYKNNSEVMISSLNYKMDFKLKNVTKLETQEVIESKDKKLIKTYKESLEEIAKKYDSLKYYKTKITEEENKLIVNTTIEYQKIDMKKYLEIEGEKTYIKHNKLKVDLLKEIYEKNGAKCQYK